MQKKIADEFFIHLLSQCYIAVGEVILLKAIQIMANLQFFLGSSQPIPNSQIVFIAFFIIFVFLNLWNVVPRFPSFNVHLFLPDESRFVLSSKSYPCMKWFKGALTGICLSVSLYCFHVSKTKKKKKIKSRGKVHFRELQVTVMTPN